MKKYLNFIRIFNINVQKTQEESKIRNYDEIKFGNRHSQSFRKLYLWNFPITISSLTYQQEEENLLGRWKTLICKSDTNYPIIRESPRGLKNNIFGLSLASRINLSLPRSLLSILMKSFPLTEGSLSEVLKKLNPLLEVIECCRIVNALETHQLLRERGRIWHYQLISIRMTFVFVLVKIRSFVQFISAYLIDVQEKNLIIVKAFFPHGRVLNRNLLYC